MALVDALASYNPQWVKKIASGNQPVLGLRPVMHRACWPRFDVCQRFVPACEINQALAALRGNMPQLSISPTR